MMYALILLVGALAQHPGMPQGMSHEEHLKQMQKDAELKKRGALAMGFDQDKVEHRFGSTDDGGSIAVDVKDPADAVSLAQVRAHLQEIAKAFAAGDFGKPFETHAEVPPGVPVMQQQRASITYRYEDTPRGGVVRITTASAEALEAVHTFLEYQRREHHAG